jgi:hypothetical protein
MDQGVSSRVRFADTLYQANDFQSIFRFETVNLVDDEFSFGSLSSIRISVAFEQSTLFVWVAASISAFFLASGRFMQIVLYLT